MPRYHFSLVDSTTVEDQGGRILADDAMATDVANRLASQLREIRPELIGKNYAIVVTSADGRELHRAALDDDPAYRLH
jgi:hypothetical protein